MQPQAWAPSHQQTQETCREGWCSHRAALKLKLYQNRGSETLPQPHPVECAGPPPLALESKLMLLHRVECARPLLPSEIELGPPLLL